jgi:hypothetical protein
VKGRERERERERESFVSLWKMAAAITCAAISTSSSAIRMSTLGFLQSRPAAIRHRPCGFVFSSLGVVEVEDGLNDSWRKCSRSSSLGVACDDRRRRRREEGLWRRLRATGEGKSEVEDGDGLSSSVKDMERYLDELSIEYDSVWDTKPAWYVCCVFLLSEVFVHFPFALLTECCCCCCCEVCCQEKKKKKKQPYLSHALLMHLGFIEMPKACLFCAFLLHSCVEMPKAFSVWCNPFAPCLEMPKGFFSVQSFCTVVLL